MKLEEILKKLKKTSGDDFLPLVEMMKRKARKGLLEESVEDIDRIIDKLYQKDEQPKNLHEDVLSLISELENAEQDYETYQESRLDKMTNEEFEQALIESMNIQPLNEIGLIGAGLIGAAAGAAATGIGVGIGKLIKHGKKRKQIKQLTEYSESLINQAKAYKASLSEEEFANLISDPDVKEFFESLDEKPVIIEKKPIELSENKLELTLEELLKVD